MRYAGRALIRIGKPAVEPLLELLKYAGGDVRIRTAEALGEIGDERAVKILIKLIGSKDVTIRSCAAEALGKIGGSAVETLIELLGDEDSTIRIHAANILGRIGDARAIEPLILSLWDTEEAVPQCVLEALDKIDYQWATEESTRKYLRYFSEALMKGNIPVKLCIIDVLEKIGDPGVSEILTKALEAEEKKIRLRAAKALEKIRNIG